MGTLELHGKLFRRALTGYVAFAIFSAPTPSHAVALTRGPYIQDLKPNSAIVVWVTDVASNSQVRFGPTAAYGSTASDSASVTQHAVTITGLSQGSICHYEVSSGGTALTGDMSFHTGKDASYNSFTFVAMGDHRTDVAAHTSVANRVALIDPEIVVDAGDLTNDGTVLSGWNTEFFGPEQDVLSRSCLFPCIGNHEGNAANYLGYFYLPTGSSGTERYYSFDFANAHFISIDNYSSYTSGSTQYNWLVSDLIANQAKPWLLVYMHWGPYSSSTHGNNNTAISTLNPLFEQYGVKAVFSGHDHDYERSYSNGIYYIVTGAGGAPLYTAAQRPSSVRQFAASTHECVKCTVTGNTLVAETFRPDGTVLDSFTVTAPSAVRDWQLLD
jgi:acid phosphatase type 7